MEQYAECKGCGAPRSLHSFGRLIAPCRYCGRATEFNRELFPTEVTPEMERQGTEEIAVAYLDGPKIRVPKL